MDLSPRPAPASSNLLAHITAILARYVSAPTAQSILGLARRRASVTGPRIDRAQLAEMLDPMERNLRLFVESSPRADECCRALRALLQARPEETAAATQVEIRAESDIVRARVAARELAASVGFTPTGQTRLVTAVSEVARNIVQ